MAATCLIFLTLPKDEVSDILLDKYTSTILAPLLVPASPRADFRFEGETHCSVGLITLMDILQIANFPYSGIFLVDPART